MEDSRKGKIDSRKGHHEKCINDQWEYGNIYNLYALNYIQEKHIKENEVVICEYYKGED